MTNSAYPLLRITLTLLPLVLLLALLRLMPFERVQSQGMDEIGIVTLEILEYGIRSASFQLNPRLGAIQYWPRTVEPISVHVFCRHPSARTAPTAPIQWPDYGELSVQVLVGPHGQMLDAQVHPSINPTVDHYAKRLACHLDYRPAAPDSQSQTEWRAVDIRFVAEPVRRDADADTDTT